jgi:hypothetical protein
VAAGGGVRPGWQHAKGFYASYQMAGRGGTQTRAAVGFLLSLLRLRFASSLFAIRETLRRPLQRVRAAIDRLDLDNVAEPEDIDVEYILDRIIERRGS